MQTLVTSNQNLSFLSPTHLNSNNLRSFYLLKVRKKVCFSSSYTTRCFKNEETENKTDPNSKLSKNGRVDVKALAFTLSNEKKPDEISELLKGYPDLPVPVYSTLIRRLGMDNKFDAAFALFNWMKQNNPPPNHVIYNSLLNAIRLNKRYYKVNFVISEMKLQGLEPDIVTYNILMSIYIEQGNPKEVFNLISQIELNNLNPSPATYSTIFSAYKELNDAYGALEFFVKLKEKYENGKLVNNDSDQENYNWDNEFLKIRNSTIRIFQTILRNWIVNEQNPSTKVLKFINNLDKNNIKPDRYFYERLVWACTKDSHYTIIKELYNRIRENTNNQNEISVSVCNHIIYIISESKKWWAALEVFEEMLDIGPRPNNLSFELIVTNFAILLNAAKRRGLSKWALKLLDKMLEKGLSPGNKEFNAVLFACAKNGETEVAINIFIKMIDLGLKPEIHSYCALLSALEKGKLFDKSIQVWDNMVKIGVKPNLYAYTILCTIYAQIGDFEKIDEIIKEMEGKKIEPSVVTFNAIISRCTKGHMVWFQKMRDKNVKPNEVSYEMLIRGLVREKEYKLAYKMFIEAFREGFKLSTKVYDLVFEASRVSGFIFDLDELGFGSDDRKPVKKIFM